MRGTLVNLRPNPENILPFATLIRKRKCVCVCVCNQLKFCKMFGIFVNDLFIQAALILKSSICPTVTSDRPVKS